MLVLAASRLARNDIALEPRTGARRLGSAHDTRGGVAACRRDAPNVWLGHARSIATNFEQARDANCRRDAMIETLDVAKTSVSRFHLEHAVKNLTIDPNYFGAIDPRTVSSSRICSIRPGPVQEGGRRSEPLQNRCIGS